MNAVESRLRPVNVVLETAAYATECIECRSLIEVTVTEVLTAGTHEWDIAGDCPECGACWHEQFPDTPARDARGDPGGQRSDRPSARCR